MADALKKDLAKAVLEAVDNAIILFATRTDRVCKTVSHDPLMHQYMIRTNDSPPRYFTVKIAEAY